LRLDQTAVTYGAERRRVRIWKMRGRSFRGGYHDITIRKGGVEIFPRLVAASHPQIGYEEKRARSGIAELDALVGGGLDYGTSNLIIGPSGSGKSTLTMQYIYSGLQAGEKAFFVSFDETERVFMRRASGLGMNLAPYIEQGLFAFRQVDPAELSPGELTALLREQVAAGAGMVVVDSLSGYQHAMPQEQLMLLQMHEMVAYLNQQGVLTFLILAQSGMVGQMNSPVDITYLADSVLLLRFFEAKGEIRRAISALKKRTGAHETTIRELMIDSTGIRVGAKLDGFRGVLTGVPILEGDPKLLENRDDRTRG
jgi:circadian clock protein KaiC